MTPAKLFQPECTWWRATAELYRDGQHGTLLPESDAAIDNVAITINRIRYQTDTRLTVPE